MDLSPESLRMTPRQQRIALLKAWSQECGLTEQQAAAAMLRFGVDEWSRGMAGMREASAKLAARVQAFAAALAAEPDDVVLRSLGIAPVLHWPDTGPLLPNGTPLGSRS